MIFAFFEKNATANSNWVPNTLKHIGISYSNLEFRCLRMSMADKLSNVEVKFEHSTRTKVIKIKVVTENPNLPFPHTS